MPSREISKLDDLMDGAVTERFEAALAEVLGNIYDLNTDPKKQREIHLVFKLKPNEARDTLEMQSEVKIGLAPPVPVKTTVLIDRDDHGVITARERTSNNPGQIDFDGNVEIPNVVQFDNPTRNKEAN